MVSASRGREHYIQEVVHFTELKACGSSQAPKWPKWYLLLVFTRWVVLSCTIPVVCVTNSTWHKWWPVTSKTRLKRPQLLSSAFSYSYATLFLLDHLFWGCQMSDCERTVNGAACVRGNRNLQPKMWVNLEADSPAEIPVTLKRFLQTEPEPPP